MSPKKVFALKRKSWLCLSSASLRHNYNKVLVGERWRSSILLGMYNNSKASQGLLLSYASLPESRANFLTLQWKALQSTIPTSGICLKLDERWVERRNFRRSGFLVDCRTKVHTYAKKEVPSLRARTQRKGEASLLLGRRDSSTHHLGINWYVQKMWGLR